MFIDETWAKTNMAPIRGWSRKGERLLAHVSSIKINRPRCCRMIGWRPSLHSVRALASSGLSCSNARRVIFEAEAAADQELRKGRRVRFHTFRICQHFRQLWHGNVMACRDSSMDEVPVGRKFAMPEAAKRLRINPAGFAPAPLQIDGKRYRCIEVRGCLMTGMPGITSAHLDDVDDPAPNVSGYAGERWPRPNRGVFTMTIVAMGLDLAKSAFQAHDVDESGAAVLVKKLHRKQMLPFFSKLPPCRIGVEACGTAHY